MQEKENKEIDDDPYMDKPVNIVVEERDKSVNSLIDKKKNSDLYSISKFGDEEEFAGLRAANEAKNVTASSMYQKSSMKSVTSKKKTSRKSSR